MWSTIFPVFPTRELNLNIIWFRAMCASIMVFIDSLSFVYTNKVYHICGYTGCILGRVLFLISIWFGFILWRFVFDVNC